MAKAIKKAPKKRAEKYEKPVTFNGTFEDMIKISATGAGVKKKIRTEFTKKECEEIKHIINSKILSSSEDQKQLREKLRDEYDFYISQFTDSKKGFNEEDFEGLLKSRRITCID